MNKTLFLKEIKEKTNLSEEEVLKISDTLDDTFIIGKKNKEKMIESFISKLGISDAEAERIYEIIMDIMKNAIKDKLKHPFKSKN